MTLMCFALWSHYDAQCTYVVSVVMGPGRQGDGLGFRVWVMGESRQGDGLGFRV